MKVVQVAIDLHTNAIRKTNEPQDSCPEGGGSLKNIVLQFLKQTYLFELCKFESV